MQEIDLNNPKNWEKNIPKRLWQLSWPSAISLLSFALMCTIDTFFIGKYLGKNELAGTGLACSLLWLIISTVFGLLDGTKTTIANAIGDRKTGLANQYFVASIYIALTVGMLMTLVSIFGILQGIDHLSENPAQANAASTYYFTRVLIYPAIFVIAVCEKNFEARGNTRAPMIAAILGNTCNAIFDYVFIVYFTYGVDGIAYATNIGTILQLCVLLYTQKNHTLNCLNWRIKNMLHIKQVWRLGKPQIIVNFLATGSFTLLSILVSLFSATDMAAQQIVLNVEHLVLLPVLAIASSLNTLVAQACGADRFELIKKTTKHALCFGLIFSFFGVTMFLFFGEELASLFIEDASVKKRAAQIFVIVAIFHIADAILIPVSNTLRAAGDVRFTAWVSSITAWCVAPPIMWLVGIKMGYGVVGGWLGIAIEIIIVTIIFSFRLQGNTWVTIAKTSRKSVLATNE